MLCFDFVGHQCRFGCASCSCSYVSAIGLQEYDVEDSVLPLQPSLNYTAPELVRNKASPGGSYSDIFSFGCLAYHLVARKPLLDCHNNVKMVPPHFNLNLALLIFIILCRLGAAAASFD